MSSLRLLIVLLLALLLAWVWLPRSPQVVVATFNIENFPRDELQITGALDAIEATGAPVVALQEIVRPDVLRRVVSERLGASWRFVTYDSDPGYHRLGVLFDSERYALDYARVHEAPRVISGGRPVVEARLVPPSGRPLRVFVVHLKAGSRNHAVRRQQLAALAPLVTGGAGDDELIVLGDFNTSTPEDDAAMADFIAQTQLRWSSSSLACTALFPDRRGERGCRGTALDHVLTRRPAQVTARGPCETDGCTPGDRCPLFTREISDHCPVTAALAR